MLLDEAFFDDPYPSYRQLTQEGPIHRADFLGGAWLLTRRRDIAALLRDDRLSANRAGALVDQFPEDNRAELAEFRRLFSMWMLFHDPPRHGDLRRLLLPMFSPESLERLRPAIAAIVDELLAAFSGGGDWIEKVAYPLPVRIISALLGVPDTDIPALLAWSDDVAEFFGSPAAGMQTARRAQRSLSAMTAYFADRENALSEQYGAADTDEMAAQLAMLLFAGHETTRNLIGNGLAALLSHPAEFDRLRREPELAKTAPDEFMRYDSPVQVGTRIAKVEIEIHGKQVRPGELLVFLLGAANRDPEDFADPDGLNIARRPNPHVSFGHGPHLCLGLALARLEAELLFAMTAARFGEIHLQSERLLWNRNFGFRGLRELAVGVSAARRESVSVGATL